MLESQRQFSPRTTLLSLTTGVSSTFPNISSVVLLALVCLVLFCVVGAHVYEHIGMYRGRHALLEWFGISSRTPDAS